MCRSARAGCERDVPSLAETEAECRAGVEITQHRLGLRRVEVRFREVAAGQADDFGGSKMRRRLVPAVADRAVDRRGAREERERFHEAPGLAVDEGEAALRVRFAESVLGLYRGSP